MGLLQQQRDLKSLPHNISYFIHLFHQGFECCWNVARVETAVIFSQKHCLCRVPTGLQGELKPYCTISETLSVSVLDPKWGEMNHNHSVGHEGGKRSPVPRARLGGSDLGWMPALEIRFIPRCCALISELRNCISCLSFSSRWNKDDISWEALWGEKAPKPYKYHRL